MRFTEAQLEKAFIELLENEGFPHHSGASIARAADEVLIEADLLQYLLSRYESKQLTVTEAKSIILQLKSLPASDLYEIIWTFWRNCFISLTAQNTFLRGLILTMVRAKNISPQRHYSNLTP